MDITTFDKDLPDFGTPFALQYLNGLLLESRAKLDICIFSASLAYRLTSDKAVRKHLESATKKIGDIHTTWLSANSTTATIKDWIAEIRQLVVLYMKTLDWVVDNSKMSDDNPVTLAQFSKFQQNMAALVQSLASGDAESKPADSLPYDQAVALMSRICGSDAVSDRTLREWIHAGKAKKANLKITFDDLRSVQTWKAWCESYRVIMDGRLRIRQRYSELLKSDNTTDDPTTDDTIANDETIDNE